MMHRLQAEFATPEGEARYLEKLRKHVSGGYLDAADGILVTDIAALDTDLAEKCAAATRDDVVLSGWEELLDAIAAFEGDPVTGLAIGMANDVDLAFEKGQLHSPYLTLGIYTDESFNWSSATREELLGQCESGEPEWGGHEEDIEVYLEIEGLGPVNTALIHHKHRFFLRDDNPDKAPLGYVEYVLASWLRALRFHQAVATQIAEHGLPGNIPVVTGIFDMNPEIASVHYPEKTVEVSGVEMASLITASVVRKPAEVVDIRAGNIRRQIAANTESVEEKRGFFARMFGRG